MQTRFHGGERRSPPLASPPAGAEGDTAEGFIGPTCCRQRGGDRRAEGLVGHRSPPASPACPQSRGLASIDLCPHGGKRTHSGLNSSLTASEVLWQGITASDAIGASGDTPEGHSMSLHPQKVHPTERPHAAPRPRAAAEDPARAEDRHSAHPPANPALSQLSTVPKLTARDGRGYTAGSPSDRASPGHKLHPRVPALRVSLPSPVQRSWTHGGRRNGAATPLPGGGFLSHFIREKSNPSF